MIRELKCPYGDDFEGGDECDRCEQYELCMETYPPVNLIEIPKGATNRDMMKAMFPSMKIRWVSQSHIGVTFRDNQDYITQLESEWWNAPYKRGGLDGSN